MPKKEQTMKDKPWHKLSKKEWQAACLAAVEAGRQERHPDAGTK